MDLNNVEFWQRTNELIKANGFTQDSLSEKCGFSKRRIVNLSSGKRLPDVFEAYLIAKELKTTVEYLVTGEKPTESLQLEEFQEALSCLMNDFKK